MSSFVLCPSFMTNVYSHSVNTYGGNDNPEVLSGLVTIPTWWMQTDMRNIVM